MSNLHIFHRFSSINSFSFNGACFRTLCFWFIMWRRNLDSFWLISITRITLRILDSLRLCRSLIISIILIIISINIASSGTTYIIISYSSSSTIITTGLSGRLWGGVCHSSIWSNNILKSISITISSILIRLTWFYSCSSNYFSCCRCSLSYWLSCYYFSRDFNLGPCICCCSGSLASGIWRSVCAVLNSCWIGIFCCSGGIICYLINWGLWIGWYYII